ncbi:acetylxylan esterase [Allokutzneria albata]|uniref:Cephalosporin-C deacetylase n=1 Tax=Allokutzneria albata TaxID=211114 RepID=A0A1G9URP7_ALLAB|nr:acetylxylan esterase [Allokutzneria albata]SDM62589.1 cephalosporin-C deacetylase [Allokutzneria albata]
MWVDLPEDELRAYRSAQTEPADFDAFWDRTLAESRRYEPAVDVVPVETGLRTVDVFDVTFPGFDGQPVKAWLRLPAHRDGSLPAVVEFLGYGGGRGHPLESLLWSSAGFAHLVMDTRGQGSTWATGDTPDPVGSGPAFPGVMTRGIESPETYYYRRVFVDAVRAIEATRSLTEVDSTRVALYGNSQGAGIALAAAALDGAVSALVARVPFLCDFPRAPVITDRGPYREIAQYLKIHRHAVERVHATLRYFDGVNFARRAKAPAWFSTALMDAICPPSTVFGAFNAYAGPKTITVWSYNEHEGGGIEDEAIALAAVREVLAHP